ncbi:MAG: hypothetical protein MZW92_01025 [Comamonadaceae bacterium]|nr:hypothetical protein [Comamonadaceae bacterium]
MIKALEAQGIRPNFIAGTSAGSVVGAHLRRRGHSRFEVQRLAMELDESQVADWGLPVRGILKGEALEELHQSRGPQQRTLEQAGDTLRRRGAATSASRRRGGVPQRQHRARRCGRRARCRTSSSRSRSRAASMSTAAWSARFRCVAVQEMGATFVIAVDIGARPSHNKTGSSAEVLLPDLRHHGTEHCHPRPGGGAGGHPSQPGGGCRHRLQGPRTRRFWKARSPWRRCCLN